MSSAHRPTWAPAQGKEGRQNSKSYSARDLSGHTKLKFRQVRFTRFSLSFNGCGRSAVSAGRRFGGAGIGGSSLVPAIRNEEVSTRWSLPASERVVAALEDRSRRVSDSAPVSAETGEEQKRRMLSLFVSVERSWRNQWAFLRRSSLFLPSAPY